MKTFRNFDNIDDALGAAGNLIIEDDLDHKDRQIVANFYNGRETMTAAEAEDENIGSVVNHLFGYSDLNGFKLQLSNIYNSGDTLWPLKLDGPPGTIPERESHQTTMSGEIDKQIRQSRRFKPEFVSSCGDLVLHGRAVLMYKDNFDWCPQLTHVYVPKGTSPIARAVPYAFVADFIPYYKLKEHLRHAEANPGTTNWDVEELTKLIEHLEDNGTLSISTQSDKLGYEQPQQAENSDEQMGTDQSTMMSLPVWYLYEVDHSKSLLPVDVKIITRFDITDASKDGITAKPTNYTIFSDEHHFKQVEHWLHPIFMDVEIGGKPTWQSATGIGQLNYERDVDVEEFFNLAMEGAKEKMRQKWKVLDGASRDKLQRFFAEKSDLIPEGVEAVEFKSDPAYQHAFNIIQTLRQLSKEEAGSGGVANAGQKTDELEIQVNERQQRAGFQVTARIGDVYDAMDDLGREIVRRFCLLELDESRSGYREIQEFRDKMDEEQIPYKFYAKVNKYGRSPAIEVKTSKSAGDGSETQKAMVNNALMGWIGMFNPEGQEFIKRRVIRDMTHDAEFAKELVPFERKPDPDQVARARTENTAAWDRGITGFIPERSRDDVDGIHMPEHQNALEGYIAYGRGKGYFAQAEAKGFESLATHQMMHIRAGQSNGSNPEEINQMFQELQKQTREAEALAKQGEQKVESEKIDPIEKAKLELDQRNQAFQEQQHQDLVADRDRRANTDDRAQQVDEEVSLTKAAAVGMEAITPIQQ